VHSSQRSENTTRNKMINSAEGWETELRIHEILFNTPPKTEHPSCAYTKFYTTHRRRLSIRTENTRNIIQHTAEGWATELRIHEILYNTPPKAEQLSWQKSTSTSTTRSPYIHGTEIKNISMRYYMDMYCTQYRYTVYYTLYVLVHKIPKGKLCCVLLYSTTAVCCIPTYGIYRIYSI
jgi:hypothetical protein